MLVVNKTVMASGLMEFRVPVGKTRDTENRNSDNDKINFMVKVMKKIKAIRAKGFRN